MICLGNILREGGAFIREVVFIGVYMVGLDALELSSLNSIIFLSIYTYILFNS